MNAVAANDAGGDPVCAADLDSWRTWVGRTERTEDVVPVSLASELQNVLPDVPGLALPDGVLPPGGHWLLFNTFAPAGSIGIDGHPERGGFLPPISMPRRMWAGGRGPGRVHRPDQERRCGVA